jgi:hypothetical protein
MSPNSLSVAVPYDVVAKRDSGKTAVFEVQLYFGCECINRIRTEGEPQTDKWQVLPS